MTPQELKNSILQLAIQGKLVPQRAEEGNAEDLYKQIQAEKQKLIKEGKIKKEKPLPPITDDEKPFEIPASWKWVRLDGIVTKNIKRGKSPKYVVKSKAIAFAQKCNTKTGNIDLSLAQFIDEIVLSKYDDYEFLKNNDIIINSTGTGTMGRVGIFKSTDNPNKFAILPDSHVTTIRVNNITFYYYVYYCLKNLQSFFEKSGDGSTKQKELKPDIIRKVLIPLPPLAEQKRIVAKIEELLPYVERYETAYNKLQQLNKRFPDNLQKSVLQLAIQGRLVPQRPEEGNAEGLYQQIQAEKQKLIKEGKIKKEKLLPPITDDEKPFEIPDSWKWVRLGEIGSWASGATPSRSNPDYYNGTIPWLKTGDLNDSYITDTSEYITELALSKTSVRLNPIGSVLIAMYGATIGKIAILKTAATTNQACCACIAYNGIYNKYLFYFLLAYRKNFIKMGAGGAQPNISKEKIVNTIFPFPPLPEQKRIVAKIEEIIPLCNKLK